MTSMEFVNPLADCEYERAWGPGGGTHAWGQNWQSAWGWDLLHSSSPMYVRAPFAGVVKSAGNGGVGRFAGAKVGINGDNGYSCFLTHMSRITVSYGQSVKAGDIVGVTGQAVGVYHLHFAMSKGPYETWYTRDEDDPRGVDPKGFLDGSASLIQSKGPKGYPLFIGDPLTAGAATPPPYGNTLRIHWIDQHGIKHVAAGWKAARNTMDWFDRHGFKGETISIAWRGNTWHGLVATRNVWKHLTTKFLGA